MSPAEDVASSPFASLAGKTDDLARRLWQAEQADQRLPLPRLARTEDDIHLAYEVQAAGRTLRESAGARLAGYKIGVTSRAAQRALGTDQAVHGYLLDRTVLDDDATLGSSHLQAPRIEPEIAFVLRDPVPAGPVGVADIMDATDHCRLALEIVDSRWRQPPPLELLIADNVSAARVVLGPRVSASALDWDSISVNLKVGDHSAHGTTAETGHPAAFVAWLAGALQQRGERLEAGHTILSGTLLPPVPARPGDRVVADFAGLGRVAAHFGEA